MSNGICHYCLTFNNIVCPTHFYQIIEVPAAPLRADVHPRGRKFPLKRIILGPFPKGEGYSAIENRSPRRRAAGYSERFGVPINIAKGLDIFRNVSGLMFSPPLCYGQAFIPAPEGRGILPEKIKSLMGLYHLYSII